LKPMLISFVSTTIWTHSWLIHQIKWLCKKDLLIGIYLLCLGLFREHESFSYSDVFIDCMRMFDSGRYVVVFCVFAVVLVFLRTLYMESLVW
jgi:hypothetical protein